MTLSQLNQLSPSQLKAELTRCCGATAWVQGIMRIFPVPDETTLLQQAEKAWFACKESDWLEAFTHHPKIGDIGALREKFAASAAWAGDEQSSVQQAGDEVLLALQQGNVAYEQRFGYIFIVCASGKPAGEMLGLLQQRLHNKPKDEILIAMKEQNKITLLRLKKLLAP